MKKIAIAIVAVMALMGMSACEGVVDETPQAEQIEKKAKKSKAYLPKNDVELNNYNNAQKVYDAKDSIIWCTTTWGNANAPLVTVPIRGKLTSSSVSFFPNKKIRKFGTYDTVLEVENRSVDGLFHGSPPAYRYGFTPGGQYVEFSNMPTLCTTALTSFQRESTKVTVKFDSQGVQAQAEKALKSGDEKAAQDALNGLDNN